MKNKEQALERLSAIESEAAELRAIIEKPELRTPEAGDVWDFRGNIWICSLEGGCQALHLRQDSAWKEGSFDHRPMDRPANDGRTYLGKFDEVYVRRDEHVKKSDVIEALSIDDVWGETVLSNTGAVWHSCFMASKEALAKLGITAK